MKPSRRTAGLLACALIAAGGCALGAWQISRGHDRAAYLDALAAQAPQRVRGVYLADRQFLLDGQAHDGNPGYHVWTPLKLASGELLMVDRGWVPTTPALRDVPAGTLDAPTGEVEVSGRWRPLPQPAIRLAAAQPDCPAHEFPRLVQYPAAAELRCLLGAEVRDGVLQLDPVAPGGFVRQWNEAGFPPARHYAYAAQWFGLALVAAVMGVRLFRGMT